MKTSEEIRRDFLEFFEKREHTVVPSASLVPMGDPTLLFTNAGMNQFKDVFLGTGSRSYKRACDTQKCLRVSGKHNDLDEVGHDTYHHTLFEMLGNWSFGDYFKKDAIKWAWELLVDQWGLDPKRLYASVHSGDEKLGLGPDEEAADLWRTQTTIPHDHILYFDSKDNFWMMGETGPCGPCSEVHIDLRSDEERVEFDGKKLVNADDPRVIEIWNLVFIQYNAHLGGKLEPLAAQHVDTGMGFERIAAVLQGKTSNYDTDLFAGILQKTADLCPREEVKGYEDIEVDDADEKERIRIAMRVIADHVRTISFAIADRAAPSNVGRGYVIRRILRRAMYYGYQYLGFRKPFLYKLAETLRDKMGEPFPELVKYQRSIDKIIQSEEDSFLRTLSAGRKFFTRIIPYVEKIHKGDEAEVAKQEAALKEDNQTIDLLEKAYRESELSREDMLAAFVEGAKKGEMAGEVAFLLHDTYGFPLDLTGVMCREQGLEVNQEQFDASMEKQRERARNAASFAVDHNQKDDWTLLTDSAKTEFTGYTNLILDDAAVIGHCTFEKKDGGNSYHLLLDRTPFYAESGGQIGDTGILKTGGETIKVLDTILNGEYYAHVVDKLPEDMKAPVRAEVNAERRGDIIKHHSATHLLHSALREVLGPHVQQQGSLVAPDRLRFDFSHFERVLPEELRLVEQMVNEKIQGNIQSQIEEDVPIEDALQRGATALFGEKYGESVRVVTFDSKFSIEFCGGTHVSATGELGMFHILSESAVASGVRRIEAVVGMSAVNYIQHDMSTLASIRKDLSAPDSQALKGEIQRLLQEHKDLTRELAQMKQQSMMVQLENQIKNAEEIGPVSLVTWRMDALDAGELRQIGLDLVDRLPENGVAVLGSAAEDGKKAYLAAAVSKSLIKSQGIKAGAIVGTLAKIMGGGGGGRPEFATAGGRDPEKLDEALAHAQTYLQETLEGK